MAPSDKHLAPLSRLFWRRLCNHIFVQKIFNQFAWFRSFELHEIIDILEKENAKESVKIYTAPSTVYVDSDKDSGDEDGGGMIDNLNQNQLKSAAEAVFHHGRLEHKAQCCQIFIFFQPNQ